MSHKYTKESQLSVTLNARHTPAAFHWRGRDYRISAIQDLWRTVGAWWDGEGETTFFRVLAHSGGIFELRYDHVNDDWRLHRVED
jgi:hypothetical protein